MGLITNRSKSFGSVELRRRNKAAERQASMWLKATITRDFEHLDRASNYKQYCSTFCMMSYDTQAQDRLVLKSDLQTTVNPTNGLDHSSARHLLLLRPVHLAEFVIGPTNV